MHTLLENASLEAPASTLFSQPQKPSPLSEDPLEESPEALPADDEWPENILYAKYVQATDPIEKKDLLNELAKCLIKHALAVSNTKKLYELQMEIANWCAFEVIRDMHQFEGRNGAKFSTWAHPIIENGCYRAMRKIIRDRPFWNPIPEEDDEDKGGESYVRRKSEEENVQNKLFVEEIRKGLAEEDRILYQMMYEERSAAEIAERFGITDSAARGKKFRLREKIKSQYPEAVRS